MGSFIYGTHSLSREVKSYKNCHRNFLLNPLPKPDRIEFKIMRWIILRWQKAVKPKETEEARQSHLIQWDGRECTDLSAIGPTPFTPFSSYNSHIS